MKQPVMGLVIFAKDIQNVGTFYQVLLDLEIDRADESYLRLEGHSIELVIHLLPQNIAASINIETPPKRRSNTALKPMYFVKSIDTLRDQVIELGGDLASPEQEWTLQDHKICDGHDPEGNMFQLRTPLA